VKRPEPPQRRADLVAAGISEGVLRGPSFRSPFRDLHVPATTQPTVRQRIVEASMLLPPGGAVGGWAAAYLLGARSFDGLNSRGELPVLLCVPRSSRLAQRPGITLLRTDLRQDEKDVVDGIPVTCSVRTAADLVRLHPNPRERVVALDALWAEDVCIPAEVGDYLLTRPRLKHAGLVRTAIPLARAGVRSRQETRLRLIWTLDARLPDPLVNERVVDLEGRHLGRPDLLCVKAGLASEFDGRDHLVLGTTTIDNVRQEELEDHGLIVVRFTGLDVLPEQVTRTAHRLRKAHERGLARRHVPRTWFVGRSVGVERPGTRSA
jgi:hypothetical protein